MMYRPAYNLPANFITAPIFKWRVLVLASPTGLELASDQWMLSHPPEDGDSFIRFT